MSKKVKGKVNPRRHVFQMTEADLRKELLKASNSGVGLALALFITVMVDKYGFDRDQVVELWGHLNKLSEEVKEGRVSAWDLKNVLIDEYGIELS
jgi:hypothetical protein